MSRWALAVLLMAYPLVAQDSSSQQKQEELKKERPQPSKPSKGEAPPEEDESVAPTQFSFNPLQSEKDVTVGDSYFKKGNYRAALSRYVEATNWNPGNSSAWLRVGKTAEKTRDLDVARNAYGKYLELEPTAKNAGEIRKKLGKLK